MLEIYDGDDKVRFTLGIKGVKTLIVFGVNPSVANSVYNDPSNNKISDPTINQVRIRAKTLGYDGFVMLNIYPQRATNPNNIDKTIDEILHKKNLQHIEEILSEGDCLIWCAWGNIVESRSFLKRVCLKGIVEIAKKYNVKWKCIGPITKKGNPHHPLYLSKNLPLVDFDIDAYMKR